MVGVWNQAASNKVGAGALPVYIFDRGSNRSQNTYSPANEGHEYGYSFITRNSGITDLSASNMIDYWSSGFQIKNQNNFNEAPYTYGSITNTKCSYWYLAIAN